jgi:hypothetical protein
VFFEEIGKETETPAANLPRDGIHYSAKDDDDDNEENEFCVSGHKINPCFSLSRPSPPLSAL